MAPAEPGRGIEEPGYPSRGPVDDHAHHDVAVAPRQLAAGGGPVGGGDRMRVEAIEVDAQASSRAPAGRQARGRLSVSRSSGLATSSACEQVAANCSAP